MIHEVDIAIIGSGFGGALLSMVARKLGLSVLLIERGQHPRFAIGESTSPLTNLLIEQIAERYDLPRLLPIASFGSWRRAYPNIVCGLKRGFTYYAHEAGQSHRKNEDHSTQLQVAANPNDELADTHWLRADVDWFFVREAQAQGVVFLDQTEVTLREGPSENGSVLQLNREGKLTTARAHLLVDATGPRGFLSRTLNLPETQFPDYPQTQALFSHFTGVRRCDAMEDFALPGTPPYPADDAALHHVFDGGWMWVLRFGNGVTSAGFAMTDALGAEVGLPGNTEAAWQRFMQRFPSIGRQFADAVPTRPLTYMPRLSYRTTQAAGDGWVMLPSAATFIDPLFSTGFPLTLLGIERLGRILEQAWDKPILPEQLKTFGALTLAEADATAEFIGGCWRAFGTFSLFTSLSMFYFTAASYSEMARRLNKHPLVTRFLAADRAEFRDGLTACLRSLPGETADLPTLIAFDRQVAESVACLNIAGLCDPHKRNWYGVDLHDVVRGAAKLELTPDAVETAIASAPWAGNAPAPAV